MKNIANRLSEYRTANNFPRASFDECCQDIENFTIARLGNDPTWVHDTEATTYIAPVVRGKGGGCCGAKVT